MKIKDFISKYIQEYPTLFKDINYEKSKLKVLGHVFFVSGNGLQLAQTKKNSDGGYFVEPKYKLVKGDWVRMVDKPYGKETYKEIPDDYFDSDVYYVSDYKVLDKLIRNKEIYFRTSKDKIPTLSKAQSLYSFRPYPFNEILEEGIWLQNDWLEELKFLCEKAVEYFNDEDQYKVDSYYPSEKNIQSSIRYYKDYKKEIVSFEEMAKITTTNWNNYKERQLKTLTDFLNK